jgi:CRISPR/Cas system-associated exonuclease Cas4 (RecB family)
MNETIQALAEICTKWRLDEKLLFVPSYSVGHQIGEVLSRSGTSWINLRVTTVSGYAHERAGLEIGSKGVRLINSVEQLLIIEKIYRERRDLKSKDRYFEGAEEIPGILKCLSRAIYEMRMEGLGRGGINAKAFITPSKGMEIAWLHQAYEAYLEENRLIDQAGLIEMAVEKIEKEKQPKDKKVLVLSDFSFSNLEKRLITLLAGDNLAIVPHGRPEGAPFPVRFFEPALKNKDQRPKAKRDIDRMMWLFDPKKSPDPFNDGSVSLFHALGESNEVREVFRRILEGKIPFDEVEVLVTTVDPYVPLIYEIASCRDLPVTFSSGIPVGFTRPGRAICYYLDWQADEFRATFLSRLFKGNYLIMDQHGDRAGDQPGNGDTRPSASRAATLLREAGIGWGRERYPKRLKALEESYRLKAKEEREEEGEEKALRAERTAGEIAWVAKFIEEVCATVPVRNGEGAVQTRDLLAGALDFLNRFCRTASEMDGAAKSKLEDLLESLIQSPSLSKPAAEAAGWLKEIVQGVSVGHSKPRPGSIYVAHYSLGGYNGRKETFFLGLDQSKFPGALLQDPVLLDVERESLGDELALSKDLLNEKVYLLAKVLSSLEGRVTLSYSCRDLREDRDLFPCSALLSVYRLLKKEPRADYRSLARSLGEPAGFIPGGDSVPLNDWEWWLRHRKAGFTEESIHRCYPDLLQGEEAERNRGVEVLGRYDGLISSIAGKMDPFGKEKVLSSSRLEALAKCPFAFFIRYVLGIEPIEEVEKDPNRWLEPWQRGNLLHDVFQRFMKELKVREEKPNLKKHLGFLTEIALGEIEKWKEEVPPASDLAFNREKEEIDQALEIFLKDEEERCKTIEPCYFEISFGIPQKGLEAPSTEEPAEIVLKGGKKFRLRGRIDRVDRSKEGEFEIWDYKTGSTWGYKEQEYVKHGRQLQHALYAVASEVLLQKGKGKKARVVRSGYYFPTAKGNGLRIMRSPAIRNELFDILGDLFELLQKGIFPASDDKDSCKFCDYDRICGGPLVAVERSKVKVEADDQLKPFKRLKDYA